MQFVVPQFLDGEAKIFFFLTVRQFLIMLGVAGGVIVLVMSNINVLIMGSLSMLLIMAGGTLAFVKVNGQLFHEFFLNMIGSFGKPLTRVWRKEEVTTSTILKKYKVEEAELKDGLANERNIVFKKQINHGSLSKLSLLVDTGGAYKQE